MRRTRPIVLALAASALICGVGPGRAADPPVRVAVLNFQDRGNHWRDYEFGRELATFFTAEIAGLEGIEIVERGADSVLWDEFATGALFRGEVTETGNWSIADVIVRGRFGGHFGSDLQLDIVDAANADILASHLFKGKASWGIIERVKREFRKEFSETAARLLKKGIARKRALRDEVRIAPLFFKNTTGNKRLDHLELPVQKWFLEESERTPGVTPLRFGGFEEAIEEQTLSLLGFTRTDPDRWKRIADYFVWGTYEELPAAKATRLEDLQVILRLRWLARDGREGVFEETVRLGDFESAMRRSFTSFLKEAAGAGKTKAEPEKSSRRAARNIANLMFERALPLLPGSIQLPMGHGKPLRHIPALVDSVMPLANQPGFDQYTVHLVRTACLFDPEDGRKDFARLFVHPVSGNPAIRAGQVGDCLSWLEQISETPDESLPPSMIAVMIDRVAQLASGKWFLPEGYRPASMKEHPLSPLEEPAFVAALVSSLERATETLIRILPEELAAKPALRFQNFTKGALRLTDSRNHLNAKQKARWLNAVWRVIPEERRKKTAYDAHDVLLKLEHELGHGTIFEILNKPAVLRLEPVPKREPAPGPGSSSPGSGPKTYYRSNSNLLHVKAPEPEKLRLPRAPQVGPRRIFAPARIWRAGPERYVVNGHMEDRRFVRPVPGRPPMPPIHHGENNLSLLLDLEKKAIRIADRGPYGQYLRNPFPREAFEVLPEIFASGHRQVWPADGAWCVTWRTIRGSESGVAKTFYRLIRWESDTGTIRDLSPADSELVRNTRHAMAMLEERWVYLIGFENERVRFNLLDLETGEWTSFESRLPALEIADRVGNSSRTARVAAGGSWLFLWNGDHAGLLKRGETAFRPADPLFAGMLEREGEARRPEFQGEIETAASADFRRLGVPGRIDPETLESALADVVFTVYRVIGDRGGFWFVHSGGVTRVHPEEPAAGLHSRVFPVTIKTSPDGKPSWKSVARPQAAALTDRYCLIAAKWPASSLVYRLHLIERPSGRHLGAVALSSFNPSKLVASESICYVFGKDERPSFRGPDIVSPVLAYSIPDLVARLKSPGADQLVKPNRFTPRSRSAAKRTADTPREAVDRAIADSAVAELATLIRDPYHRKEAIRYDALIAAVEAGNPDVLGLLLRHGADPNAGIDPPPREVGNGYRTLSRRVARKETPLMRAAAAGNREGIETLLAHGAYAPLKDELFANAVDRAADPDLRRWMEARCRPQFEADSLFPAVEKVCGRTAKPFWGLKTEEAVEIIAETLAAKPALIHIPMERGQSIFEKLLERYGRTGVDIGDTIFAALPGIDPNGRGPFGRNLLAKQCAPENRSDPHMIELALKLGCDPRLKDEFGKSALDYLNEEIENEGPINSTDYRLRYREAFLKAPQTR